MKYLPNCCSEKRVQLLPFLLEPPNRPAMPTLEFHSHIDGGAIWARGNIGSAFWNRMALRAVNGAVSNWTMRVA
jgi:hypothetical protein